MLWLVDEIGSVQQVFKDVGPILGGGDFLTKWIILVKRPIAVVGKQADSDVRKLFPLAGKSIAVRVGEYGSVNLAKRRGGKQVTKFKLFELKRMAHSASLTS